MLGSRIHRAFTNGRLGKGEEGGRVGRWFGSGLRIGGVGNVSPAWGV